MIDPKFKGKEVMPILYQEDDRGKLVEFNPEKPIEGPIFGLAEVDDIGEIDDKTVGKPKRKSEVNLIKVDNRKNITELSKIDELSELSSESDRRTSSRQKPRETRVQYDLKPEDKVYAKVECSQNGRVIDPNFQCNKVIPKVYQEDEDGNLIEFDF